METEDQDPYRTVEIDTGVGIYFLPPEWHLIPIDDDQPVVSGWYRALKLTWDQYPEFYCIFDWYEPRENPVYGGWELSSGCLGSDFPGTWLDHEVEMHLMPWKNLQDGLDQVLLAFGVNIRELH